MRAAVNFKKRCLNLISKNDLDVLLNDEIKSKLNSLEHQYLPDEKYNKVSQLQNKLAQLLGKISKNEKDRNFGEITQENYNVVYSKLQNSCVDLIDAISEEPDFFVETGKTIPRTLNYKSKNFNDIDTEASLNKLEISYQNLTDVSDFAVFFMDIDPMREKVETVRLFDILISMNRVQVKSKHNYSYLFNGVEVKCINEIRDEHLRIKEFRIYPVIVTINSKYLPNVLISIHLKLLMQMYNIPVIFCFLYEYNPEETERVKDLLEYNGILIESRGGPYQCQEVCGSNGKGVQSLFEKIFLEIEFLELT